MSVETLSLFLSIAAVLVASVALVQSAQANAQFNSHQAHHIELWAAIFDADPAEENHIHVSDTEDRRTHRRG